MFCEIFRKKKTTQLHSSFISNYFVTKSHAVWDDRISTRSVSMCWFVCVSVFGGALVSSIVCCRGSCFVRSRGPPKIVLGAVWASKDNLRGCVMQTWFLKKFQIMKITFRTSTMTSWHISMTLLRNRCWTHRTPQIHNPNVRFECSFEANSSNINPWAGEPHQYLQPPQANEKQHCVVLWCFRRKLQCWKSFHSFNCFSIGNANNNGRTMRIRFLFWVRFSSHFKNSPNSHALARHGLAHI